MDPFTDGLPQGWSFTVSVTAVIGFGHCAKAVVTEIKTAVNNNEKRFKIVVLVFIRSGINCS